MRGRERGRPECFGPKSGLDAACSLERGDEPHLQLAQARQRPETPERSGCETKLAFHVARTNKPPERASEIVEVVSEVAPLFHVPVRRATASLLG